MSKKDFIDSNWNSFDNDFKNNEQDWDVSKWYKNTRFNNTKINTSNNEQQKPIIKPIHYKYEDSSSNNEQQGSIENNINQNISNNIDASNQMQGHSYDSNSQQAYNSFNQQQNSSHNQNFNNERDFNITTDSETIDLSKGDFLNPLSLNGISIPTNNETVNNNSFNVNGIVSRQISSSYYEPPIYEDVSAYNNQSYNYNTNNISNKINQQDFDTLISIQNQITQINQNEGKPQNRYLYLCGEVISSVEDAKLEFKKCLRSLKTQRVFVKLFLESKRIKVIGNKILCNLKSYWQDTSIMNEMKRYEILSSVFYIKTKEILGRGINLVDINRLIGTDKELWSPIEKMIISEREFLFESGEENKSLKNLVRENPWINFKSYIVNPITLEVIKKESIVVDGIEIDNTSYILNNNITFDCCINADPEVVESNGVYKLKEEDDIDADIFESFYQTSLGGNSDKRKLLLQHIGYSICSNKDKKKALYVIGDPDTGKTRIKDLFFSFYEEELITDKTLNTMNSDAARHELMNSKMSIADEADGNSINKMDTFKKIVSGEEQSYKKSNVEKKDRYNIGLVFLANEFIDPVTGNETPKGYLEKFSVLVTETFDFKYAKFGKEKFKQAFISEENKTKVVTLALYELNRLYKNDFEFVETEDAKEEKINHVDKWVTRELKKGTKESYIKKKLQGFKYSPYEYENEGNREYLDNVKSERIDKINSVKNKDGVIELFPSKETTSDEDLIKSFIDEKLEIIDIDLTSSITDMKISMEDLQKNIFNAYKNKYQGQDLKSHRTDGLELLKSFTKFKLNKQPSSSSNSELKLLLEKIEIIQNKDKSKIKEPYMRNKLPEFLELIKSELSNEGVFIIEENKYKLKSKDSEKTKEIKFEYQEECRKKSIESILDSQRVLILKELSITNKSGSSSRLGFVGIKFKNN